MKVKKYNDVMYVHCELTKRVEGGMAYMHSWIREKIAKVGNILDNLEDLETGSIRNGWTVKTVTYPAYAENFLLKEAHDYDKMKRRTDI